MLLHILDILGAVFSFFSTLFYVLALEICWPLGVVATIINACLYGLSGIYGDMGLEIIYFFLMFYGWYEWRYGGRGKAKREITHLRALTLVKLIVFVLIGVAVTFGILKFYTSSTVPALDSVTTVLSLAAQTMMCLKIIETWIVLICSRVWQRICRMG